MNEGNGKQMTPQMELPNFIGTTEHISSLTHTSPERFIPIIPLNKRAHYPEQGRKQRTYQWESCFVEIDFERL